MNVELVSVGTELLLGDIINTNTAYLAQELANLGINIYKQTTVGDNRVRLLNVLERAFESADTVIITGGLGPTDDDITREVAAEYFEQPLEYHENIWQAIVTYLTHNRSQRQISVNNQKQAYVPKGAMVLMNPVGTAPGLILKKDNRTIILLPGPPHEMTQLFEEQVKPYLAALSQQVIVSKYVRFFGIGESQLEIVLKPLLDSQTNPTLALYAKPTEVLLRVTATGATQAQCLALIEEQIEQLYQTVGEYIYFVGDSQSTTEMNRVVAELLLAKQLTISIAESLTGGAIASSLVEQSGMSKCLIEGVVCYSNNSKIQTLAVPESAIIEAGAVSEVVAEKMVLGIVNKTQSDVAIATTGIAGPTSDESGKPVGLVYIATYVKGQVQVREYQFYGNRELIRKRATYQALNQLRQQILQSFA